MKLKTTLMVAFALVAATFTSHAATMLINNVNNGPGDTLFAGTSNALLSSGIVGIGYFPAGIADTDINTAAKLLAQIGTFTADRKSVV